MKRQFHLTIWIGLSFVVVLLAVFALPSRAWGSTSGRIYWTDGGTHKIQCAGIDIPPGETPGNRSDIEDLITDLNGPFCIAIDSTAGKMYWTGKYVIRRADLDGANAEDLVAGINYGDCLDIALDPAAGKMYWTDPQHWSIRRANMEIPPGETPSTRTDDEIIGYPSVSPGWAIDVDTVGGKVYFNAWDGIYRVNLDGTNMETIVSGWSCYSYGGLAVDPTGGKVYFGNSKDKKILCANLDGSDPEDLLVIDPVEAFFMMALDIPAGKMYWTDTANGKIRRANLDGSGAEDVVTGLANPNAIAVAPGASGASGVAFWSDHPQVQTFTPSMSGKLVQVDLALNESPSTFNEMVHVSIVEWNTNQPGIILGGSDFLMDDYTGTIDLSSHNIMLGAGSMYGIMLTNDLSYYSLPDPYRNTGIDVEWDTDPYSGGSLWTGYNNGTDWQERVGTDVVFTTYIENPEKAIEALIEAVISLNLQQGIANSLDAKLGAALNALDDVNTNNDVAAINALEAFINAVEAQSGDKIPEADADGLIQAAVNIINMLTGP